MKILDILSKSINPKLYEKGTSFMWTDKYISKQLLNIHLNPDIDLASRKITSIKATANWIMRMLPKNKKMEILDLGCGPGLYAEIFAQNGHNVTGVDISQTSIDYAKKEALRKKLDITYINANYLELELAENKYDLVTLIYTDLGALLPHERAKLLNFVYRIMKKGGVFVFDVLNDTDIESKTTPKNWEVLNSGFWKESPHIALSESFLYRDEKVILYQNIILDEKDKVELYRFWTHFFSQKDLEEILKKHKFHQSSFYQDVLPKSDIWNGDNVIFCKTIKE